MHNERQREMLLLLAGSHGAELRPVIPISLGDMVDRDYLVLLGAGLIENYHGIGGTVMCQLTDAGEAYVVQHFTAAGRAAEQQRLDNDLRSILEPTP